jgi:DNA-binding response OmpR family regulator
MSGYTADAIVHHGVLDAGLTFLQKPFRAQELLTRIREVLDSNTPPPS